ncbi:hypothetical protein DRQ20_01205 [bacterium]|nr:MAG: hypothetical protein DRQ20_01205 [bacterium]
MEAYRMLHPELTVLLTTVDKNGKGNVCAVAWNMPVSEEPFCVAFALDEEHLSTRNLMETDEFILNIPGKDMLEDVWFCGTRSGRKVDKLRRFEVEDGKKVKVPRIKGCAGYLEGRVIKRMEVGECVLFVGEIVHYEVDKKLFGEYWKEGSVLLHLGGKYFTLPGKPLTPGG